MVWVPQTYIHVILMFGLGGRAQAAHLLVIRCRLDAGRAIHGKLYSSELANVMAASTFRPNLPSKLQANQAAFDPAIPEEAIKGG